MLISWNWLKDYVKLDMPPGEVENRLAMSGLNHESTERVGDDLAIDLEVTSNRPDCLGHIGVAREIAVLFDSPLTLPTAAPKNGSAKVGDLTKVTIKSPELCSRYTARVIRGVKVGPSPKWLADRLSSIGVAVINNVVDVTNYVLMECGQPLHAFDLGELGGPEIIVREALKDEEFEAIDHKTYTLEKGMCVIADTHGAVALGGVMGGADTEVSIKTTDLLIEAAEFLPLSIRNTARKLKLFSDSSYRFERGIDPNNVDWASRRCCELILDIAGGELAEGIIDVGGKPSREPVVLRLPQLKRILGIEIDGDEVRRILSALGGEILNTDDTSVKIDPPSWRRDLTREIDLVEEVARIHGYDKIPEDAAVPMAASHRGDEDRVLVKTREVMTGTGFDEALTASMVPLAWCEAFSPWSQAEPIVSNTPLLRGADRLRRSLIPSLMEARRINESLANAEVELFETAKVYLPDGDALPREPLMLGIASGGDFFRVKGALETLLAAMHTTAALETVETSHALLDGAKSCELRLGGELFGFLGEVSPAGLKQFGLRSAATVAEVDLGVLGKAVQLIPQYEKLSDFPVISRDLNLVVDEPVHWSALESTVRDTGGEFLETVDYRETYRDAKNDGAGKKRMLFSFSLRSKDRTLTSQEADEIRDTIVAACGKEHAAVLLG